MRRYVWYVWPQWHRVSFSLIAEKHLKYINRYVEPGVRIESIDELAFPHIDPHTKPLVVMHPYFFMMVKFAKRIARRLHQYAGFIGIDVADSDRISNLAVSMTNYAEAMIVPSTYAKRAYERSGVTVPVYVVPHGLEQEWYTKPNTAGHYFADLLRLKRERGLKYILFFLWHSSYRKGWDLVIEFYRRLRAERKDVVMVLKTYGADTPEVRECKRYGCIHIYGWLTEEQKMELFDLADLYPLFTRGGGFEMNGLEAIARLVPTIAAKGGSWEDYLPDWSLVDSRPCPYVLKDNPIHDGRGVEVNVEKAVDKAHVILDNLDEYRGRLLEWRERVLKERFTWDVVAKQLYSIIRDVLDKVS